MTPDESVDSSINEVKKSSKRSNEEIGESSQAKKNQMIADIFGESEEEDSENEMLRQSAQLEEKRLKSLSFVERITEEKKQARLARKKREQDDAMGQDEFCAKLVDRMFKAAEDDRIKMSEKELAIKKIKMIDSLRTALLRPDRYESLTDHNVHAAITEWLRILPDNSLPNLRIRRILLNILKEWPRPSSEVISNSGLIRTMNILIKHPRELSDNKQIMKEIIFNWTKPIRCNPNYHDNNDDFEEALDYKNTTPKPNIINTESDINFFEPKITSKPGDKDFSMRAKIPSQTPLVFVKRPPKRKLDEHMTNAVKARMREIKQTKRFRTLVRSRDNRLK